MKRKGTHRVPQPGDPDFKTPTQLRNARKRKKRKLEQQRKTGRKSGQRLQDPSSLYLSNPEEAPVVRRAKSFFEQRIVSFPVLVGPTSGWRTVAKLAVREVDGCLRIGMFSPGTHDLIPVPESAAHHPRINSAVSVVERKCRHFQIRAFDEKTGEGNLRHLSISIERMTGRQQITFVWFGDEASNSNTEKLDQLCRSLIDISNENGKLNLHSMWVHYNSQWKHSNSIFDRNGRWRKIHGDSDAIVEYLDIDGMKPAPLEFPPQVFRQANLDAFSKIVSRIRQWMSGRKRYRCVELYGGVGTIGLNIADLVVSLVSSDENPFNKKCFESSVAKVPGLDSKPSYCSKSASSMVKTDHFRKANLLIVDPPRKGLDQDVAESLCSNSHSLQALVYVSCGFDGLTHSLGTVNTYVDKETGSWRAQKVTSCFLEVTP